MDNLLDQINALYAQHRATEFEIRRLEKQAATFLSRASSAAEGYMALGLLSALRLDFETSKHFFKKARQLAPADSLILANQAKAEHGLGNALEALETISRALSLADSNSLVKQAVHIALSALQIDRASQWQKQLAEPVLDLPISWLDAHLALLEVLRITADDLTRYRDRIAATLVSSGHRSDRGRLSFGPKGQLKYSFDVASINPGDKRSLEAIAASWKNDHQDVERQVIAFFCRIR